MQSIIQTLSSSHLIAKFQRLCGVEWLDRNRTNSDNKEQNLRNHSDNVYGKESRQYSINNKVLFYSFHFGSMMAAEPFYYVFLALTCWMLDIAVSRKTMIALSIIMYVGQSAKDILKRPRPPSPPVIRLEKLYETEYGMPSTHTMAATVVPFALLVFSMQSYEIPFFPSLLAAITWTAVVATSRIYLGMHSVWQIIVGVLGSEVLLFSMMNVITIFDETLVESPGLTAAIVTVGFLLSYIIFQLDCGINPITKKPNWNTARGDTAELLGMCTGFIAGSNWSIDLDLYKYNSVGSALLTVSLPDGIAFKRTLVGALLLAPSHLLITKLLRMFLANILSVPLNDTEEAKKTSRLELPYKYLSGLVAGSFGTSIVPWVLYKLKLW